MQDFDSSNYVSGNNNIPGPVSCPCQNNPDQTNVSFHGPLPLGDYSIGPQKPNSSRRDLQPINAMMGSRDSMQIHGCGDRSKCSDGCIAATTNATRDQLNKLLNTENGSNTLHVVW
jgi:hypothetical protein